MKKIFIETRKKFEDLDFQELSDIPGKTVSIVSAVQYLNLVPEVRKFLESLDKKVFIEKGVFYPGHILGCNSTAINKKCDSVVMLADGKFHAINNAIQSQKEIYVFNGKSLDKISRTEIENYNKKITSKKKKFLERIEKEGKKVYIFESNNVDLGDIENYPEIKIWVNTACFGLARDHEKIVNLCDILEFIKS
jgi:diphthamide synthase subunit DPH2